MIVDAVDAPAVLPLKAVSRRWHAVITCSPSIKKYLFLTDVNTEHIDTCSCVSPTRNVDPETGVEEVSGLVRVWPSREVFLIRVYLTLNACTNPDHQSASVDVNNAVSLNVSVLTKQAWATAWVGEAALVRNDRGRQHGNSIAEIKQDPLRAPVFAHLVGCFLDARRKTLRELAFHPLFPLPAGPSLEDDFIARVLRVRDTVIVVLPRTALEVLDELAERSPSPPQWATLPLTNPPVTSVLLRYYHERGPGARGIVQVSCVIEKQPGQRCVVFGDLVGRVFKIELRR